MKKSFLLSALRSATLLRAVILSELCGVFCLVSCARVPEMSLAQIEEARQKSYEEFFTSTVDKPYNGEGFVSGRVGGDWYDSILSDPKTFNQLVGERDGSSAALIAMTTDSLFDYDFSTREWKSRAASFVVETDEAADTLVVHVTLQDNMFWTYINSDEKIPVTSDDIVWWYNEISGDPQFQSSAYSGQFVTMKDGQRKRIEAVKIDDKNFDFVFPRIVADPILACNDNFAPSFIYKKAKEEGGADGVLSLFGIDVDVQKIPSMGMWHIESYAPSQQLVFVRNKNYWQQDDSGENIPYRERLICQIIGDQNTEYLLFKQGKVESYSPPPEYLDDVIRSQNSDYTVFNSHGSLGASLWSFNQNPRNKNEAFYDWFTKKEFRQAMSCVLNRDRIIAQAYRGLAFPKYDFFPEGNQFHNPQIELEYKYDLERAKSLLQKAGFKYDANGTLRDEKGRAVEYDLTVPSTANSASDIGQIITEECKRIGIKVNVRQTDFQKMVEMLTKTFDWQSIIIGLGTNLFPSQGSNVWPSDGNLHLWHPLQKRPATDWEARIDYLYNEGSYTIDKAEAKKIWDEYQSLILEQCPIIYLVRPAAFFAIRNKWSFANFYYDNLNGAMTERIYQLD